MKKKKIFVIEAYLCEKHGYIKNEELYENLDYIKNCNDTLKKYYDYIRRNYPEVTMIDIPKALCFTDDSSFLGVQPWYYNQGARFIVREKIENKVQNQRLRN